MKLMNFADVCTRMGMSRSAIERLVLRGEMPGPVMLPSGAVRFIEDEIQPWIGRRPRGGEGKRGGRGKGQPPLR